MTRRETLNIGITIGDPAGIGPEVTLRALRNLKNTDIRPVIIGRKEILEGFYSDIVPVHSLVSGSGVDIDSLPPVPVIYDVSGDFPVPEPGVGTVNTGAESKMYIDAALDLWKAGQIDAMVTGPVHKGFIEKSGTPFTGHTEYIARYIGEDDPFMMMYSPKYRVLLASTHVPLESVAASITVERLLKVINMGYESMKAIDGGDVKLAITGFDPHCGDDGAIGDFDMRITKKAVEEARAMNIPLEGPFSADTLFMADKWAGYNLVIAQYHDQGLIPFKVLAFDTGVNVTLGLSIVRTSVDHGTAFDIAGEGYCQLQQYGGGH